MKLVTYRASVEAGARLGVLVEGMVVDVARLGEAYGEAMPCSMLGLVDLGPDGTMTLAALLDEAEGSWPPGCAGRGQARTAWWPCCFTGARRC